MPSSKAKAKPKRAAAGKPRDINNAKVYAWCATGFRDDPVIRADIIGGNAEDARRVADWLLKAADWADAQAARRKGGSK